MNQKIVKTFTEIEFVALVREKFEAVSVKVYFTSNSRPDVDFFLIDGKQVEVSTVRRKLEVQKLNFDCNRETNRKFQRVARICTAATEKLVV